MPISPSAKEMVFKLTLKDPRAIEIAKGIPVKRAR
jgi:hypothetical protein